MNDLNRFIEIQKKEYYSALEEIKNGKKVNHWMWYIFPQIKGLGTTKISVKYSVDDIYEAKSYLEDDHLRDNLVNICNELLKLNESDPIKIFGYTDSMKLKSSMTLFDFVIAYFNMNINNVFSKVLEKYYDGEKDDLTIGIIALRKKDNYCLKK